MQWIALDHTTPTTALQATKHTLYTCPECQQPVKLRSGPHRQPHFYHLRAHVHCHQHTKSEEHIRLQLLLASLIPEGQWSIERPFPQIQRIADVAWESRQIVFEIQCSPISLQEVEERCHNYRSMGWEIVWILSDKRFNKKRLSAAESYLRLQPCYFANVQMIYDQYEILQGHRRSYKGAPLLINPVRLIPHQRKPLPFPLSPSLQQRWDNWSVHVEGDILSKVKTCQTPPHWMVVHEEADRPQQEGERWWDVLKKIYARILRRVLRSIADAL